MVPNIHKAVSKNLYRSFVAAGVVLLSCIALRIQDSPKGNFQRLLEKGREEVSNQRKRQMEDGKTPDYSTAIDALKQAVSLNPSSQEAHYYLGCAYDYAGSAGDASNLTRPDRSRALMASSHFRKVIDIDSSYPGHLETLGPYAKLTSIWASLAYGYASLGDMDSARSAFVEGESYGAFIPGTVEYARNSMSSCDRDAILFANGDMDTFPLYYLQVVEGYRTDITVVNLSLLNANWYDVQITKRYIFGKNRLECTQTEDELTSVSPRVYSGQNTSLEVPRQTLERYGVKDREIRSKGAISWYLAPTFESNGTKALRVQDIMVLSVLKSNAWRRPVYFSVTTETAARIGLDKFLRLEGLALKLVPYHLDSSQIDEKRLKDLLMSDEKGFSWRGLKDVTTMHDSDLKMMAANYQYVFESLASAYYSMGSKAEALRVLERMERVVPSTYVPLSISSKEWLSGFYVDCGNNERARQLSYELIEELSPVLEKGVTDPLSVDHPYVILLKSYQRVDRFDDALMIIDRIVKQYGNEPDVGKQLEPIRRECRTKLAQLEKRDTTPPQITITQPVPTKGMKIVRQAIDLLVKGTASDESGIYEVSVNGAEADLSGDGRFSATIQLAQGENTVTVRAVDKKKNVAEKVITVTREAPANISPEPPRREQEDLSSSSIKKGKYYALVIGIDKYSGVWPPLRNALHDAQEMADILVSQYKFDTVMTLYDQRATRANVIDKLEWLSSQVTQDDNVLIFYSGHGDYLKNLNRGFWVPADALSRSFSGFISNADLQILIAGIQSKHTLVIADACFSGEIFRGLVLESTNDRSERYYVETAKRVSRQAITSGGIEPVTDGGKEGHSVFTYYLLKGLKENSATFFDAGQLYERIKIAVANNSDQTPMFNAIKNTGDEGGQFIFKK